MTNYLTSAALLAGLALAPAASAQRLDLNLDHLQGRATGHTLVDLDGAQLRTMANLAVQKKPGKAEAIGKAMEGLQSVRVRTFEFSKPGEYTEADLEPVRKQLQAPGWSRIVSVKEKSESTEVNLMSSGGAMAGLAVVVAEPRELTVVNIVGSISMAQVQELVSSHVKYDLARLKTLSEGR